MGTSSRRTIPRIKNKINELNNNQFNDIDLKHILKDTLFPRGKESFCAETIIKSFSSPNFIKSIKNIVSVSNSYSQVGFSCFGINDFDNYSKDKKIDFIADYIVDYEDPIFKQSIKDVLLDNGIENLLGNDFVFFREIISSYIGAKFQSQILDDLSMKYDNVTDFEIYSRINRIVDEVVNIFITQLNYQTLVVNLNSESYVEDWVLNNVGSILKAVVI